MRGKFSWVALLFHCTAGDNDCGLMAFWGPASQGSVFVE